MSVWKARELWDAPFSQDNFGPNDQSLLPVSDVQLSIQCSRGCLCIVRIPERPGSDILIVGTWSGSIRGFCPEQTPYSPEHVLFEKTVDSPVLQLETGNFILGAAAAGTAGFQLAVLHPDKLSICYFSSQVSDENSPGLVVLRSYKLKSAAYSLVTGSFSGVKGRQMLCVVMMDGTFTLIDQETVMETPPLEDFLLPGPICYLPGRDCFVVGCSTWIAECYTYSELASKAGLIDSKPNQEVKMRKSWTYNCGEALVDIKCGVDGIKAPLLLLGERHIFWLDMNGAMRSIRRLDCQASFLTMYPPVKEGVFNAILGTTTQTLFVYEELIPKWTAQLPTPVVDIRVARIASGDGVLIALAEDGRLTAFYLGTDPEVYETKNAGTTRQFNEEEIRVETNRLSEMIRLAESGTTEEQLQSSSKPEVSEANALVISVAAFTEVAFALDVRSGNGQCVPASWSQITIQAAGGNGGEITDVEVVVQMEEPFHAIPSAFNSLLLEKPYVSKLTIQNSLQSAPRKLSGTLFVNFRQSGVQKMQKEVFNLPFALVAQGAPLTKKAAIKLDFDITPVPLKIFDAFPDFGQQQDEAVITFDFYGVGLASLLISKKQETKTRIQSDDPSVLLVLCQEVQRRMGFVAAASTMVCASTFPADEFTAMLQNKLNVNMLRKSYDALLKDLDLWTQQLFLVEKRFLARLKDRDVLIVSKLEELLEFTQEKIMGVVEELERTKAELEVAKRAVSSMVALMHWLVALNNQTLSADQIRLMQLVVHDGMEETSEESWETQSAIAAKYYGLKRVATDNVSSGTFYHTELADPSSLLKRAYLNQLNVGETKVRKETRFAE